MTLPAKVWIRFTRTTAVVSIPVVGVLISSRGLDGKGAILHVAAFAWLALLGLSGAAFALLTRTGVVVFHYDERDKRTFDYRIGRQMAQFEYCAGRRYAASYYKSFDVGSPEREHES